MRRLLVVVLILVAGPAEADLTSAEKAQNKAIYVGARDYWILSLSYFADLIGQTAAAEAATAGSVTRMNTMWSDYVSGTDKLTKFFMYAQGIRPNDDDTQPAYITNGKTSAFNQINPSGSMNCAGCPAGRLKSNFSTFADDTSQSAGFRNTAQLAENAMDSFIAVIAAQDDTVGSWDTALPSYVVGTSATSIRDFGALTVTDATLQLAQNARGPSSATVGPHGNYVAAMRNLGESLFSFTIGMGFMRQAWNYQTNSETVYSTDEFEAFGTVLVHSGAMINLEWNMMLALADIATTNAECGKSTFRMQVDAMGGILSHDNGLPFHFQEMSEGSWETLTEAMVSRPVARVFFSANSESGKGWQHVGLTSWRYSDGATGLGMFPFPIPKVFTLGVLRDQFQHSNSTHTPPMCPDAVDPVIVSIDSPTASEIIGGMVLLQATATDNIAVNNIKYFIGAQQLGVTSTVAPWIVRWDSTEIANGARTITVRATDAAGNDVDSTVNVTVSN